MTASSGSAHPLLLYKFGHRCASAFLRAYRRNLPPVERVRLTSMSTPESHEISAFHQQFSSGVKSPDFVNNRQDARLSVVEQTSCQRGRRSDCVEATRQGSANDPAELALR